MELNELQFSLKSYTWSEKQELESNGRTLIVPWKLPARKFPSKGRCVPRSFRKRPLLIRFSLATSSESDHYSLAFWVVAYERFDLYCNSLSTSRQVRTVSIGKWQRQKRDKNTDLTTPHSESWESLQCCLHRGDAWSYSNSVNKGERQCNPILGWNYITV